MKLSVFLILIFLLISSVQAQDPTRFQGEVDQLQQKEFSIDESKQTIVFTGSSSVRMWTNVDEVFPEVNAINTGFGGSQFSDLIHYRQELIFEYNPDKVFIYEGDNDIAEGKSPEEVTAGAAFLYAKIREKLPNAEIYFISPKPSISRWQLEEQYLITNEMLKEFCEFDDSIHFVDVWFPMLNEAGDPKADIFIEDDLHMNSKGYEIWTEIMEPFVDGE